MPRLGMPDDWPTVNRGILEAAQACSWCCPRSRRLVSIFAPPSERADAAHGDRNLALLML